MSKGLKGSDVSNLFQTQEDFENHLESFHHIIVRREGETLEGAVKRFLEEHPEAVECDDCRRRGAPWAT